MALAHRRPYGVYRVLANAPRWFYRLGLGWVLGHCVAQITYRGRKSGELRRTILEVLRYDPHTRGGCWWSPAGKAKPIGTATSSANRRVRTGRLAYRPVQEFLSPEETARLILTLFHQHPREVRWVGSLLGVDPDVKMLPSAHGSRRSFAACGSAPQIEPSEASERRERSRDR